ncbi:3-isopropylmalate dehydratase small subunit [Novosphingobium sp. Leaf2]|uniref:3-isopropylmalate dehydratase small subunit n=1 Tax=Novosphingobium sp. Leaf2 TaxID=1735670 RepID=UPI0006F8B72B|nr:3-isopropylmalate dehydratase small subunit [Novosphingobium sp. Leaf2]KQM22194.1 3-isopropylmalate dehydratase [Novosphingobium sp. Leaf2]
MTPLVALEAKAVPLMRDNIDTDAIIPSREMKSVSKTGLADGLFAGWRYVAPGSRTPDPAFVLNDARFADAQILIAGANFGCGSSREHAVWALAEYGFRVVIAPSFSPIFRGNCVRNGIAPIALAQDAVTDLAAAAERGETITIDLETRTVRAGSHAFTFAMEDEARTMLMEGLDAIELTLKRRAEIAAFREADARQRPWVYLEKVTGGA